MTLCSFHVSAQQYQFNFNLGQVDPEIYADVIQHMSDGDYKKADKALKKLPKQYQKEAEYYAIEGHLSVLMLTNASTIRMPFLIKGAIKSYEQALSIRPDYEEVLFVIANLYFATPSMFGGDLDKGNAALATLYEIGSDQVYAVEASRALVLEKPKEERDAAFLAWVQADPGAFGPSFNWLALLINEADYVTALERLQAFDHYFDHFHPDRRVWEEEGRPTEKDYETYTAQRIQVYYQWLKFAAESGTELDRGRAAGLMLLDWNAGPNAKGVGVYFTHARLAQVYHHLGNNSDKNKHKKVAEQLGKKDRELKKLLKTIP